MRTSDLSRRHGFSLLRGELLEQRMLLAVQDVHARDNLGLDLFAADPQYSGIGGQGYSIAILDGGLAVNHPYFGPDLINNGTGQPGPDGVADRIVHAWNYTSNPPGPTHVAGDHATHVTGIAAGFKANVYAGVAPGANIIALQVLSNGPLSLYYDEIEAALQWIEINAVAYNIVAVNMSFSESTPYTYPRASFDPNFPVDDKFFRLTAQKGVIPVASVGNRYGGFRSQINTGYPAADPNVLGVGATWAFSQNFGGDYYSFSDNICGDIWWVRQLESTEDQPAPFSQRHPVLLDVFAPGASVFSSLPSGGGSTQSGVLPHLKLELPFVTGAVAIAQQLSMRERGVRLSFTEFRDLIQSTGATVQDNYYDPSHFQVNANNPCNNQMPVPSGYDYKRLDVYAMANQLVAPKVSGVKIGSSSGSVIHPDYTVPVGTGDQLKTIPVGSPNEIMITFTEAVDVVKADLSVVGAASGTTYNVAGSTFSYDTNSKTAKWTFASAFPPDQLVITLDDGVTDTAVTANGLDGEWANPASLSATGSDTFPSGNGTAGGDFTFRITILPGDVTRNNVVDLNDLNTVNNNWLLTPATWIQGDQSGDNLVNQTDKNFVLNNFGRNYTSWPGGGGMMMMSGGGGGEGEIGEAAARQALLDYYSFRLANPKSDDPFAGLLGSSILGNAEWWNDLLGEGWEQLL